MSSKRTRLAPIEVPDPANILSAIPGEFIAAAAIELPDAETCEEEYQQALSEHIIVAGGRQPG